MSHIVRSPWFYSLGILIAMLALLSDVPKSSAEEEPAVLSALTLISAEPSSIRNPISITVQLTNALGEPVGAVANEALELYVARERVRRVRTEEDGTATFTVRSELPAGRYPAQVLYSGSKSLGPSIVSFDVVIEPITLEIVTVPALSGVEFTIDGESFWSDHFGIARYTVESLGEYQLDVHPVDSPTRRLKFNRWQDEVFASTRVIDIRRVSSLEVGFDVSYQVELGFYDLEGLSVDPNRISTVVLRSSHGTERVLEAPNLGTKETDSIWLQSGRVVRRFHGLDETPIVWSVERVEIDGTNVVNRAQQRFFVDEQDIWNLELLLYEAYFTARDALFSFPLGRGVNLEYPNGTVDVVSFDRTGEVHVQSLPRGEYRVNVAGAPGYSPYSPVALSRNQEVHLLVISYFDMAVAATLLVLLAIGLVVVGRPSVLRRLHIPGRTTSHRRAFLVMAAIALVTGVSILSFGLGKDPSSSRAETATTPVANHNLTMPVPPEFTTGDPDHVIVDRAASQLVLKLEEEQYQSQSVVKPRITSVFLPYWKQNGGLARFGYPKSMAVRTVDSQTGHVRYTQQFDYFTLEYREEYAGSFGAVGLLDRGRLHAQKFGLLENAAFAPRDPEERPDADCRYFRETGHFVCNEILVYWESNGLWLGPRATQYQQSLALFGYPISEAFEDPDSGRVVQYFERVRLEVFPEFLDTVHAVQQADLKGV